MNAQARPDFLIIGAMKSATTTLHEQLARQPGFCMSRPKEPNFFGGDDVYARGFDWYASIFRDPRPGDLLGSRARITPSFPSIRGPSRGSGRRSPTRC